MAGRFTYLRTNLLGPQITVCALSSSEQNPIGMVSVQLFVSSRPMAHYRRCCEADQAISPQASSFLPSDSPSKQRPTPSKSAGPAAKSIELPTPAQGKQSQSARAKAPPRRFLSH